MQISGFLFAAYPSTKTHGFSRQSAANRELGRSLGGSAPTPTMQTLASYAAVLLLGFLMPLSAVELVFTAPTATFTAPVEASGHDVTFAFSNTSADTITITDIQTGCGCVTSAMDKRIYQPGESGTLKIHVDFQDRTGPIKKTIRLKSKGANDSIETEQRLKIDGVALTPLALSRLTVSWALDEAATTKEILVMVKEGYDIADLRVEDPDLSQYFKVQSHGQKNGGLAIAITPLMTIDGRVSLDGGREQQQAYFITYRYLKTGQMKRERFYAILHRP
jgi:hypothetical protein